MIIPTLIQPNAVLPQYATPDSAGVDLVAVLEVPIHLKPLARALIPTGLHMAIPRGFEGQVRPRSGLALKQGLTVLNSPGTIDADYRGEIKVILINLSENEVMIEHGMRIAQLVIAPVTQVAFSPIETDSLDETVRGSGGFGSTGVAA
jgi:dUTP pyrophosphatase